MSFEKVYISTTKGIKKLLEKTFYKFNHEIYLNLNQIRNYDNGIIIFNSGAIYTLPYDSNITNFEVNWRSHKITNFYKNDR